MLFWGGVLLIGAAAGVALLLVGGSSTPASTAAPVSKGPAATWPAGKLRAPAIALHDENGAPVSLASYRGRPVLVTFIDPLCRDFCPLEAKHLSDVVRGVPAGSRPAIIAVSVNVRGNAKIDLLTASRKWKVVPEWHWGVGDEAQLARVWKGYHIGVLETAKRVAGVTVHDIVHTEASYLIDAAGYQRAIFLWPYTAAAVSTALARLGPTAS